MQAKVVVTVGVGVGAPPRPPGLVLRTCVRRAYRALGRGGEETSCAPQAASPEPAACLGLAGDGGGCAQYSRGRLHRVKA